MTTSQSAFIQKSIEASKRRLQEMASERDIIQQKLAELDVEYQTITLSLAVLEGGVDPMPAPAEVAPKASVPKSAPRVLPSAQKYTDEQIFAGIRKLQPVSVRELTEHVTGGNTPVLYERLNRFEKRGLIVMKREDTGLHPKKMVTLPDYVPEAAAAPVAEPSISASELERRIRDFFVNQTSPFNAMAVATALNCDIAIVRQNLNRWVERGSLVVERSDTVENDRYRYQKPTHAGPVKSSRPIAGSERSQPVAGTGKNTNANGTPFIREVMRHLGSGARVDYSRHGHPKVVWPNGNGREKSQAISSSPSDVNAVQRAVRELRAAGCPMK
jgi:hypothetical protein